MRATGNLLLLLSRSPFCFRSFKIDDWPTSAKSPGAPGRGENPKRREIPRVPFSSLFSLRAPQNIPRVNGPQKYARTREQDYFTFEFRSRAISIRVDGADFSVNESTHEYFTMFTMVVVHGGSFQRVFCTCTTILKVNQSRSVVAVKSSLAAKSSKEEANHKFPDRMSG